MYIAALFLLLLPYLVLSKLYSQMVPTSSRVLANYLYANFKVFVRNWPPMASCTPGETGSLDSLRFSGYSIELLRLVFSSMDISSAELICSKETSLDYLIYRMNSDKWTIVMAEGNFRIQKEIMQQGYYFTQPTFNSDLRLVVRRKNSTDIWAFLAPLSWDIILFYVAATFFTGVLIWLYEEEDFARRTWNEHLINMNEVIYNCFTSYYATNSIGLKKISSRIVQWTFWLVFVIFVALYQADLTSKLSTAYFELEIKSFQNARDGGKRIGVMKEFLKIMDNRFPITKGSYVPFDNSGGIDPTVREMLEALTVSKSVDALLLELPLINYYAKTRCDLETLDESILQFNYGSVFDKGTNPEFITEYSKNLIRIKESYQMLIVGKKTFPVDNSNECDALYTKNQITLEQLAGLWIILLVVVVLGIIIYLVKKFNWIKLPKDYLIPYYCYYNEKTELFENQLKDAIEFEATKVLSNYQQKVFHEIEQFENCLLLQDDSDEGESDDNEGFDDNDRSIELKDKSMEGLPNGIKQDSKLYFESLTHVVEMEQFNLDAKRENVIS